MVWRGNQVQLCYMGFEGPCVGGSWDLDGLHGEASFREGVAPCTKCIRRSGKVRHVSLPQDL